MFPPSIDEYVDENNAVRAIDAYVEMLDVVALGFSKAALNSADGQPAYHPKLLLKIYVYGYLNKIRSSRKLEIETKRNIEMMWLCANLKPSYKTIADFRKENSKPLKKVFREFVLLCKEVELIDGSLVAVDGAFLRANASKNRLIMKKNVEKDLQTINANIEEYLKTLEYADAQEKKEKNLKPPTDDLDKMKKRKTKLDQEIKLLEEMGLNQYNRTDPDAKLMVKPAHNLMAYNAQIAVDSKYKFIVATDVSGDKDIDKLSQMAHHIKEVTQNDAMVLTADAGYYNSKEIKKCVGENINVYVPSIHRSYMQKAKGKYTREAFVYQQNTDSYLCPNGQYLIRSTATQYKNGKVNHVYQGNSSMCQGCLLRSACLPDKTAFKKLFRWEDEGVIEQHLEKMQTEEAKVIMKQRAALCEHPFGTIKRALGWDHFLVRGKEKVSGENALIMFTYNFKRLLNLIGIQLFQKLLKAVQTGKLEAIKQEIAAYIATIHHYLSIIWENMMRLLFLPKKVENLTFLGV